MALAVGRARVAVVAVAAVPEPRHPAPARGGNGMPGVGRTDVEAVAQPGQAGAVRLLVAYEEPQGGGVAVGLLAGAQPAGAPGPAR
ncbi:hypothetical protein ACHZ98_21220 [Streptomyces sp. MAR4 CNY-716]